jgi:Ser-tRNA(Ala) deacylase AlaX
MMPMDSRVPVTGAPAYHRDAYLIELDSEVVEAGDAEGGPYAVLADTIFYPEGGGQPADRGRLGDVAVLDVQAVGGEIRHYVDAAVGPGPVHLELDWPRRFDHMQQHTAQHLLTAVALRDFGWRTTAFHLGPEISDIELDVPKLERADLDRLEAACAVEVRAARAVGATSAEVADFERLGVRSRRLPEGHSGPLRLVEIEGLDRNTCGGTHLRSTSEIGLLCLLGTEPMRGGTRLFFAAGDRVRRRMAAHEDRNLRLRSLLGARDDELPEIVALRLEKEKELARAVRLLGDELAAAAAAELAARPEPVVDRHWPDRDMGFLQLVARRLAEAAPGKAALLTAAGEGESVFVVAAGDDAGVDLVEVGPHIAEKLEGRGGGRPPVYQGKAASLAGRPDALAILQDTVSRSNVQR